MCSPQNKRSSGFISNCFIVFFPVYHLNKHSETIFFLFIELYISETIEYLLSRLLQFIGEIYYLFIVEYSLLWNACLSLLLIFPLGCLSIEKKDL